ncbi:hypothetical protein CEW89_11530 [Celeribacter ethanolicus]|uniref:Glycosyltransferase subfamily 4-like N-terminal domain-containing protein n=1 Tax=Celeribacter ethanolicus TaxID=1758178 RepID=A0A291GD98_9RHOB|nr:glycosyltransferase [Celeribacter ethanolicus]ATG48147.1 hypothetical protein CEW89_11530 [Celeribacter ethanolicus]
MTEKQRILVLTPAIGRRGGGVSEAARLYAEAVLADGRFDLEVVTLMDADFETDRDAWPDIPIHAFKSYGPARYGFSPGMLRYVVGVRAATVHVHGIWTFHVFCAALWSLLRRRPALVTPHGMLEHWILQRSPRLKAAVSTLYQQRFLRSADLHVLTEKEKADVAAAGLPTARCHVIPNYVLPFAEVAKRPGWWRPEFAERRVYLFLGRIHDKKGWRELCAAWDELSSTDPSFRDSAQLVFCGWPDDCPDFEPTIEALHERFGNALFAGPQYGVDRDRSLAAADIFLLPSKSEGLPMSVLEAWAAGVPCMMTRACNLDQGFDAGAAFETRESAESIATTLRGLQARTTKDLNRASLAAKSLVAEKFSQKNVGQQLSDLFQDLITKQSKRLYRD